MIHAFVKALVTSLQTVPTSGNRLIELSSWGSRLQAIL